MVKHNFRVSGYDRNASEKYYTPHWCSQILAELLPDRAKEGFILEPSAGRGDITYILQQNGMNVVSYDKTPTEDTLPDINVKAGDFFDRRPDKLKRVSGLITNPPFGGDNVLHNGIKMSPAEKFVRHALTMDIDYVAMLMRTDWNHSKKRKRLFSDPANKFAYEVVLTQRPRWDWWYDPPIPEEWEEKPKKVGPMHNFSWFVWDKNWEGPSTQYWRGPEDIKSNTFNNGEADE